MGNTKRIPQTLTPVPALTPAFEQHVQDAQALAVQTEKEVASLAQSLGYEGALTEAALEDGIRFYQRRSVEALLECGKRLILLKRTAPHGEFMARVQSLGFSYPTAARFMQAAEKTAKSLKLRDLSGHVRSTSAFLELVTHDDDADIERIADMDDIDRLSASQLRERLREAKAEAAANTDLMAKKNARIDRLEREKKRIADAPPDEHLAELKREATSKAAEAEGTIVGGLRHALIALKDHGEQTVFMAGLVGQVQAQLSAVCDEFELTEISAKPAWEQWADAQGLTSATAEAA